MAQQQNTSNHASPAKPESAMKHILSFVLMIALTVVAFALVMYDIVPTSMILPLILVLAAIQVFLQLFTFMHLDQKGTAYYTFFILVGILIAVVSAVGIVLM
ncbi:cytochrome C oxidase subunit IV family protein [Laceyella putida]|uniref:Cytochrome C oxidase subunit IV family protein n=1 Tax=Laceyella putida TaxID=110101 RepID=A0ABW2RI86_9BACL